MGKARGALLCAAMAAGILVGCKSQPKMGEVPMTGTYTEPQWVTKGVSAFPDEAGEAFYGVGVAERKRVPDLYLRRKAALERAKADVAGQLRTFVQQVFKDYVDGAFTPAMDEGETRSLTSVVQKSVIDETLLGAETRDVWTHPATGDVWALVRVSMDSVAQQLRDKIAEVEKGRLRMDAAAAHRELDQIIEKNRQRLKEGL